MHRLPWPTLGVLFHLNNAPNQIFWTLPRVIEDTCKFKYLITGNKLQFGPSEQRNTKRKQNSGAARGASNVPYSNRSKYKTQV